MIVMNTEAESIIDHLGGTSAVARLTSAPTSTVHSWKKNGIPASRLAHLRLVAKEMGKPLPEETTTAEAPPSSEAAPPSDPLEFRTAELTVAICNVCDARIDQPGVRACSNVDCPHATLVASDEAPAKPKKAA